jgi:glycerol-3-phosphate dehydrogenase
MAEDAIDHVQLALGLPVTQIRTANHPLSGASGFSPEYASELSVNCQLPLPVASHLVRKFGTAAQEICVMVARDPAQLRKIVDGFPAIEAEIAYSIRYEMAATVEDILARRIGLQYYSWALAEKAAPRIANYLAGELGWSEETRVSAVGGYVEKLRRIQRALGLPP